MSSGSTTSLFYRDLGARWQHDDSRWRPMARKTFERGILDLHGARPSIIIRSGKGWDGWECSVYQAHTKTRGRGRCRETAAAGATARRNGWNQECRARPRGFNVTERVSASRRAHLRFVFCVAVPAARAGPHDTRARKKAF
jgi:hypothetical protein